jgi:ACS family tartrate transporter-like MFS transporter
VSASGIEQATMRRVRWRLLPLLFLVYLASYIDRSNVGIAALQMNHDLGFSAAVFGIGSGIFFLGYSVFEVPSNLILVRLGARVWIARIAITWGLTATAMMLIRTPAQFYLARSLLGLAEAGLFPGIMYYINRWFPPPYRARAVAAVTIGIPLAGVLGNALGGLMVPLNGVGGLWGWQWLFLLEGLPSVLMGFIVLERLTEHPREAQWLSLEQREWLAEQVRGEERAITAREGPALRALANPMVWILTIPYFALFAVSYTYTFWAPTLVHEALGAGPAKAGLIVAAISVPLALLYPFAGKLADYWGDRCGQAAFGLALQCAGCIGVAVFPDSVLRIFALTLIPAGSVFFLPPFWCLPAKFLKGGSSAVGIALISSVGTTGGFFGPSIVGLLKELSGSDTGAFVGLAVLALAGTLMCLALRHAQPFRRGAPASA